MMTPKLTDTRERISPEDIALAFKLLEEYQQYECRTYAFNITSDIVTQREETQS